MKHKRVLLIDGDIIAYRAASIAEKAINWGDGLWTLHAFEEDALRVMEEYHQALMEKLKADHAIYALTDSERNWRLDILPTYKGNRKDTRKPMLLPFMRQYLLDNYDTFFRPRLEGDDILGILSTHPHLVKAEEKIIVSLDKDMKTIPGLFYREGHDEKPRLITEEEANFWHLFQTLTGDATDGYSGCPGVGPVAAEEILNDPWVYEQETYTLKSGPNKGEERTRWIKARPAETPWEAVVSLYAKAGLTEEHALRQAQVARILRATEYDFTKKVPIPWTPKE